MSNRLSASSVLKCYRNRVS